MTRTFCKVAATLAILNLVSAAGQLAALGQGNQENPGIVPPKAKFEGRTYSQWQARFEVWVDSIPAASSPLNPGGDVLQGQSGDVWFLTGTGSFTPEVRDVTIPAGKALFFPILVAECS